MATSITFGADKYNSTGYDPIDEGTYEFTIKATKKPTKDGTKEYLNLEYIVRNDVDQKFKGSRVFDKAFQDKATSDWFDLKKLNKIIISQPNPKLDFQDVDECILYINGKHVRANVTKTFNDYFNKEENQIDQDSISTSEWDKTHPVSETTDKVAPTPAEDTLPF